MICSRCGVQNSKTSKYCRECGKRLMIEALELEVEESAEQESEVDDTVVAELLHESLKSYEKGRLQPALVKCQLALRKNPNSPSGRSLLSLIYEKKAEEQLALGNREDGEDFLRAAIRQTERVLESNPESVADREKLDELYVKLDALIHPGQIKQKSFIENLSASLKLIPVPVWAGVGTFMLVLVLASILLGGGSREDRGIPVSEPPQKKNRQPEGQGSGSQTVQPGRQLPPPVNTPSGMPAWTYNPQAQRPLPTQSNNQYQHQPDESPYRQVPPLPEAIQQPPPREPEPLKPYPVEKPEGRQSEQTRQPDVQVQPRNPSLEARAAFMRRDYQTAAALYQEAIAAGDDTGENEQKLGMCLYNLSRGDEAIIHFQRAVQLYMAQKAQGIDVEGADTAIKTCKFYIDVLVRR